MILRSSSIPVLTTRLPTILSTTRIFEPSCSIVQLTWSIDAFQLVPYVTFCYPCKTVSGRRKVVVRRRPSRLKTIVDEITGNGSLRLATNVTVVTFIRTSTSSSRTSTEETVSTSRTSKSTFLTEMSLLTGHETNICTTQPHSVRSKTCASEPTSFSSSFTAPFDVSRTLRNMSIVTRVREAHTMCWILSIVCTYGSTNLCTSTWYDGLVTTFLVTVQTIHGSSSTLFTVPIEDTCRTSNIYDAVRAPVTRTRSSAPFSQTNSLCY